MDEMRVEIDRLEAELGAARKAVREHLLSGVAVWYGDGPSIGTADTTVDQVWRDRYAGLKAAADEALTAANEAWERWAFHRRG